MKSDGDKWADSKARFTVSIETDEKGDGEEKEVNESILLQEDIWGVHNSTTSLTFLEKFALTESVPKGQPMKYIISHVRINPNGDRVLFLSHLWI